METARARARKARVSIASLRFAKLREASRSGRSNAPWPWPQRRSRCRCARRSARRRWICGNLSPFEGCWIGTRSSTPRCWTWHVGSAMFQSEYYLFTFFALLPFGYLLRNYDTMPLVFAFILQDRFFMNAVTIKDLVISYF